MPLGAQAIPVNRDDVEGPPPALGVEISSDGSSRAGSGASTASLPNNHYRVGRHRSVGAETVHVVSQNLTDQPDALVIPITLGGIRGAITARFIKFPFHDPLNSEGYQYDLA